MNFAKIEDIGLAVGSFLRDEYPIAPVVHFWTSLLYIRRAAKLKFLKNSILEFWDQYSLDEKIHILSSIEIAIQDVKQQANDDFTIHQRVSELKAVFCTPSNSNWKDALLMLHSKPIFSKSGKNYKYYLPISYQPNSASSMQLKSQRFHTFDLADPLDTKSFSISGTTFSTNREAILNEASVDDEGLSTTHVLDSSYCAYILDERGRVNGAVIAIADGCGGHFGSAQQDQAIAKTAYVACRHAVRLLATYSAADAILADIPALVNSIKKEIETKYVHNRDGIAVYQESATLACGRSFITDNGYRFVGFSIGDSMIGAWNPKTKIWRTLAPGRVRVFQQGQTATAIFPAAYSPEEIHPIDVKLEWGTILIPLTDGVYDNLPCERKTSTYADGSQYQETRLNARKIQNLLSPLKIHSTENIINTLADYAISLTEAKRAEALTTANRALRKIAKYHKHAEQLTNGRSTAHQASMDIKLQQYYADSQIQLGDDFTLFGVRLPKKRHAQQSRNEQQRHNNM